jgi:hypothetical protein
MHDPMSRSRICLLALCFLLLPGIQVRSPAQIDHGWRSPIPAAMDRVLDSITAQSLRSHVSFLASDALSGRTTPSIGQDAAAEYIAAQFRKAGLEPIGSTDYFQVTTMPEARPDCGAFKCEFSIDGKMFDVSRERFALSTVTTLDIERAPVFKMKFSPHFQDEVSSLSGKILLLTAPDQPFDTAEGEELSSAWRQFMLRARSVSPTLIVWLDRHGAEGQSYFDTPQLRAPGRRQRGPLTATIAEPSIAQALGELPDGDTGVTFSLHVRERPPVQRRLRNVAAILRGSDPALRETCVLLTAHYDGTGPTTPLSQDRIWNAANDDASGVASVLDVALALGSLREKPRRSIVFLAFFGEEEGMLGSRYYANHPLVPLRDTIAAINLEQLGRTDSSEGDQAGKASVTGCDYSDVVEVLKAAGEESGITVARCGPNSDMYFTASDNIAFAEMGVPAHTLCVSYMYPDYHGPADHWEKIDFDNMARVTRMAARALLALSMSDRVPVWNRSNPRTLRFDQARGRRIDSH